MALEVYLPADYAAITKAGGIAGFVFLKKSEEANLTVGTESSWTDLITANTPTDVKIFGRFNCEEIQGTKPAAENNIITIGACQAERTISSTETYTITDYGFDSTLSIFNLYEFLEVAGNTKDYLFAAITADGYISPFMNPKTVTSVYEQPETNADSDFHRVEVKIDRQPGVSMKPTKLDFIENIADLLNFRATA